MPKQDRVIITGPCFYSIDYGPVLSAYNRVVNNSEDVIASIIRAEVGSWKRSSDFISKALLARPSLVIHTESGDIVVLRRHFRPLWDTGPFMWDVLVYDEMEPVIVEFEDEETILRQTRAIITQGYRNCTQGRILAAKQDYRANVLTKELKTSLSCYNFAPVSGTFDDVGLHLFGRNGADISIRRDGVNWAYTVNGGETRTEKIDVMLSELTAALSSVNTDADTTDEENISL